MKESKIINVNFDNNPYEIHLRRGVINSIAELLKQKTKNNKVIIVADSFFETTIVSKISQLLEKENFTVYTHLMDAGKGNKNINEVLKIYSILEENDLARDSTLIAVGGGVVGDLAGFVASTWYRGMKLIHIPTTLMAMVDSSVGGKVAINFRQTINAIGNYYHPIFTLMDLDLIDSLPQRDYISGIAEVIKCAIISDKKFFNYLEKNVNDILKKEKVLYLISKAIQIKIDHVNGDVKEGNKRLLLNYGHTLGHAIEISTEKNHQEQYRHGEGVSIGIAAVASIATKYLNLDLEIEKSIIELCNSYGLPTYVDSKALGFEREILLRKCKKNVNKDKKRINNKLRLLLADEIGKTSIYSEVPFEFIENAFDYIIR